MSKVDELIAANRREREESYRRLALKLYPPVCGRCARECSGKRLSELTVHHRDHNHDTNPAYGSNWELLCLYCHDNEHARDTDQQYYREATPGSDKPATATYKALGDLARLLGKS